MNVVIGVDPHKASHTAVAINEAEDQISSVKVRATRRQVEQLVRWAEPFEKRRWAIESAGGMGYLLAQQLVACGEEVLDVPATLASRIRVLATGRSNKNDPNDAHSIAVAALRAPSLRSIEAAEHSQVLRLLAKRNVDLGSHRTRVVCRLHALLAELAPGGIAKELYVSDAESVLGQRHAAEPNRQWVRYDMALELLDDVRRLDEQTKAVAPPDPHCHQGVGHLAHSRSTESARSTPRSSSAMPVMFAGSPTAMPSPPTTGRHRSSVASGRSSRPPGVPTREPSGQPRAAHGRRHPDPQSRDHGTHLLRSQGRRGQDQKGSPPLAQAPDLQRRLSTVAPRRPIGGPGGHQGTTRSLRDRLFTLHGRLFGEVTPEPRETLRRRVSSMTVDSSRLESPRNRGLDSKRIRYGRMQLSQARRTPEAAEVRAAQESPGTTVPQLNAKSRLRG